MPIDKLIVRQEDGDAGVEIGTGTNKYIIQGNFLLFGKSATDLTRIANKIYTHIADGAYYRPCEIELKGNPCIEIGDGIALVTRNNDRIVTFVTHRVYSGIQAQRDICSAEGTEYRDEDVNSYDTQLHQLRNKSNILTRDLEHTESVITDEILNPDNPESLYSKIEQTADDITSEVTRATNAEGSLSTRITQNATDITAKVNKNSPTGQTSFSWEMTDSKMEWKQNGNRIMLLNSSGLELSGKVTAKSGYIGNGTSGFSIGNTAIYNGISSMSGLGTGVYIGTDGINLGYNFRVTNQGVANITSARFGKVKINSSDTVNDGNIVFYQTAINQVEMGKVYVDSSYGLNVDSDYGISIKGGFYGVSISAISDGSVSISGKTVSIEGGTDGIALSGKIGFFNKTPIIRQRVLGSTDSQKLSALITALEAYGLIVTDP